jgi:FdhD protein
MAEPYDIYEDRELIQYTDGQEYTVRRHIAKEVPLTIMLNGEELATVLCSPYALELLALGFLVSEGILQHRDELKSIAYRPEEGAIWVETATGGAERNEDSLKRNPARHYGKEGLSLHSLSDDEQVQPVSHTTHFTLRELLGFVTKFNEEAHNFRLTGGIHEAALAHREGFVVSYEDVGRHNALDRLLGYTFLNDIDTSDKAVILSGRIASERVALVARIGVPVVVSLSAPTCLSIAMAEQLGITLVGFARGNTLNVYTHPDRIVK